MSAQDFLRPISRPEIIVGLVAPLGAPLGFVETAIKEILSDFDYECETIRLSRYLENLIPEARNDESDVTLFDRFLSKMKAGSELRSLCGGEILPAMACAEINARRPTKNSRILESKSFIIRQLKHPDEVQLLRRVYGSTFHLIGITSPEPVRLNHLLGNGMREKEAETLIKRDYQEETASLGQQLAKTFHKSDLFVDIDDPGNGLDSAKSQLDRYFKLLFGSEIITPTIDEYGLYMAKSASLRSSDLSRQVGAAILSRGWDVMSVGANEVPAAHGGQYCTDKYDERDFVRRRDENEIMRRESLKEVMALLFDRSEEEISEDEVSVASKKLKDSRLMNLTEFGRATHAEMEAILSAARRNVSVRGSQLFSTTFPCHNCAKHIVGAGIDRVVYVEPYPKSLANRLHGDAISFSKGEVDSNKIPFVPFSGISPRRYSFLFSNFSDSEEPMGRKNDRGELSLDPPKLRMLGSPLSHIQREGLAADFANKMIKKIETTTKDQQ